MGKIRHIELHQLWVQDKVARGGIKVRKIGAAEHIADHLTKYLDQEGIREHMCRTSQWIDSGRHYLTPNVCEDAH